VILNRGSGDLGLPLVPAETMGHDLVADFDGDGRPEYLTMDDKLEKGRIHDFPEPAQAPPKASAGKEVAGPVTELIGELGLYTIDGQPAIVAVAAGASQPMLQILRYEEGELVPLKVVKLGVSVATMGPLVGAEGVLLVTGAKADDTSHAWQRPGSFLLLASLKSSAAHLPGGLALSGPCAVASLADLDGNGENEVICAGAGSIDILDLPGKEAAPPVVLAAPQAPVLALIPLDLDGDGRIDLTTVSRTRVSQFLQKH
jgi:hypothetical protein